MVMRYEAPSASLEEALQRISAAKRERDHFCPIMSPPAAKRRCLARMKKKKQRQLVAAGPNCRVKVTMQDYYCYRCHYKENEPNHFLCYGKLAEQAKVDGYACVEEGRLTWLIDHQDELRCDFYQGVVDALGKGTLDGSSIGKKVLPASFTGGKRYMTQNCQDAIAICQVHGSPDWFTTFTCNPKWQEIVEALECEPGQLTSDRSDIIVRVYKMKLDEFMGDIKDGTAFGPIVAVLQSTEFQKRGLPHAHLLAWLDKKEKEGTTSIVDSFVSAEIPDPELDPLGYSLVQEFMIHGPCGDYNKKCVCFILVNGYFQLETVE